ncbi:putative alanyl-trna synthetase [Phaeomoniella chlamydospora]|uniref:Putative alanyl-trna synthetase n=1 Tax=Phaeomoniella chlamydospora TaxID=158046 RepID=A0A0G2E4N5_PHACM|nr:putative alanyl-trna synthetase [Phaeomoniella chlamydospora]
MEQPCPLNQDCSFGINRFHQLTSFPFSKSTPEPTRLLFHHDAKLHRHETIITEIQPLSSLCEADQSLFKQITPPSSDTTLYIITVPETIFHPQGGGQPSDVGTISSASGPTFTVLSVRTSTTHDNLVLHLGHFDSPSSSPPSTFSPSSPVTLSIDPTLRHLYSRLHTAGHVLGAAVRTLLETKIPNFDELKASHFPDSAACEFLGLIPSTFKPEIQTKVNEMISSNLNVEIDWWDEEEFLKRGLERLLPKQEDQTKNKNEKLRVVKIEGTEVYPCGGTHVDTTDQCGKTTVRKISRNGVKGTSKVSYAIS